MDLAPDPPRGIALWPSAFTTQTVRTTAGHALDNPSSPTRRKPSTRARRSPELQDRDLNRSVGTMLGSEISPQARSKGLADNTSQLDFTVSARPIFGAFVPASVNPAPEGTPRHVGRAFAAAASWWCSPKATFKA